MKKERKSFMKNFLDLTEIGFTAVGKGLLVTFLTMIAFPFAIIGLIVKKTGLDKKL